MNKLIYFIACILFFSSALPAQLKQEKTEISIIDQRRNNAQLFYDRLITIAEPSSLSGGTLTDFTKNEVDSLQKKRYVLNAEVQYPIALGGKRWYIRNFVNSVHIIPQFKVRILNNDSTRGDSSLPVRTPSYMPRLTYYFSWKKITNFTMRQSKDRTQTNRVHSFIGGLSVYHHSNGQDGLEFTKGNINYYNGNFSENAVFEYMFIYIWQRDKLKNKSLPKPCGKTCNTIVTLSDADTSTNKDNVNLKKWKTRFIQDSVKRLWAIRVSYEDHPASLTTADLYKINNVNLNLYGRRRVNFQGTYIFFRHLRTYFQNDDNCRKVYAEDSTAHLVESHRITFNSNIIVDDRLNRLANGQLIPIKQFDPKRRINVWITYYNRTLFKTTPNVALFLQAGYFGSDNYNIYFAQTLNLHVRFGIAVGGFRSHTTQTVADQTQAFF